MTAARSYKPLSTTVIVAILAGVGFAAGADQRQVEVDELRAALSAAVGKSRELAGENVRLKQVNRNLSESLMAANAESEEFRKSYGEIRLQMEALGIEAVTAGKKGIEAKLLKAVNDIRLLDEQKLKLSDALIALSDAALRLVEVEDENRSEAVMTVEQEIALADDVLGLNSQSSNEGIFPVGTIHNARIISTKKDHGILIFNVGRAAGVRVGMPFRLNREDRPIGRSIVVDVRDNISAAIVQNLEVADDIPRVGDIASVATTQ